MTFRYFFTLCLLWSTAWGLLGCGGGSDAKNTGNADGSSATSPVQAGVYFDGSSGHEFWGVITPGNRWYGLNYKTAYPDIYSGDVSNSDPLHAAVSTLKYQTTTNTFLPGSASFTSSGSGKLYGTLSVNTQSSIPVVFNAVTPSGFVYNQAADINAIAGNWTGKLSSNRGEFDGFSINITATANSATLSRTDFDSCHWSASNTALTRIPGVNLFALTLQMDYSTSCNTDLDGQALTGVAFITTVPGGGSTRRLIWVATTTDGHAISFKADR